MNAIKIKQPRDARGRFIRVDQYRNEDFIINPTKSASPSRLSNFLRLLSHNRLEIATFSIWIVDCFVAGFIGGYFGVKIGLG